MAAKIITLCLLALWFLLSSWAALIAWGLVSQRVFRIPDPASTSTALEWTLPRLSGAPFVVVSASVAVVCLAVLVRSGLGALLGGAILLTLLNIATRFTLLEPFSPAAWVAAVMRLQTRRLLVDHVWAERSVTLGRPSSAAALLACAAVLLVAAVISMRRRDVLT